MREFPDEFTLALELSECPNNCKGCHSAYLRESIGEILDTSYLDTLIDKNSGITCVGFMGGDAHVDEIISLADYIRSRYGLRVGWYSGRDYVDMRVLSHLDYVKIGHYEEKYGPLDSETTNQIMFKVQDNLLLNITKEFQKSKLYL